MIRHSDTLTLLSGSSVELHATHTAILPEAVTYEDGTLVTLENDKHEFLGTAEITDVQLVTFALVQKSDLVHTCHPDTATWSGALHTLATQAPGFSQLDKVSIVRFVVDTVSTAGLTINAAEPTEHEPDATVVPTFEEQLNALDTVTQIGGENATQ